MRLRILLLAAGLLLTSPLLRALPLQESASDQATIEAWLKYQEANQAAGQIRTGAREAVQQGDRNDPEVMKRYRAEAARAQALMDAATEPFLDAFAASDWDAWDAAEHGPMLQTGFQLAARHYMEHDPARAAVAYETMLRKLPDFGMADRVRTSELPRAWIAAGPPQDAVSKISAAMAAANDVEKLLLSVQLGDARAIAGDLDGARAAYQNVADGVTGQLERGDPRAGALRNVDLRLKLVGKTAPEIDFPVWVGGEPAALSAHTGKVVLVDFWATWCGPCRAVMPALNAMYNEMKDQGVAVLGVTRFYENGFLPDNAENLNQGASVRGITEAGYVPHLQAFRDQGGIDYPFVVAAKETFEAYGVTGIPTLVVVGPDGKVRFVAIGSGSEPLIRAAVEGMLSAHPAAGR